MDVGTLWEYKLLKDDYTFEHCQHSVTKSEELADGKSYVYTSRTAATAELLKLLITNNMCVLIDGPCGSGKTSFVLNSVGSCEFGSSLLHLLMNKQYTTIDMWTQLKERLTWHSGNTYVPMGTDTLVTVVDDLHLTQQVIHTVHSLYIVGKCIGLIDNVRVQTCHHKNYDSLYLCCTVLYCVVPLVACCSK